jgi:hypothetical protein
MTRVLMVMILMKVQYASPLGEAAPSCKINDEGVDGCDSDEGLAHITLG